MGTAVQTIIGKVSGIFRATNRELSSDGTDQQSLRDVVRRSSHERAEAEIIETGPAFDDPSPPIGLERPDTSFAEQTREFFSEPTSAAPASAVHAEINRPAPAGAANMTGRHGGPRQ